MKLEGSTNDEIRGQLEQYRRTSPLKRWTISSYIELELLNDTVGRHHIVSDGPAEIWGNQRSTGNAEKIVSRDDNWTGWTNRKAQRWGMAWYWYCGMQSQEPRKFAEAALQPTVHWCRRSKEVVENRSLDTSLVRSNDEKADYSELYEKSKVAL